MRFNVVMEVSECVGRQMADDVLHPETQEPIVRGGQWLTQEDVDMLLAAGCDYIPVY
jgi:2-iminoacetate synthase ThiH